LKDAKSVGVTSCHPGAGVSTVAANLAVAAAQTGTTPVVLVDLSGQASRLGEKLSLDGDLGLLHALGGAVSAGECVRATAIENLSLLGLGRGESASLSSFDGKGIVELLYELERDFSFVVIDLPPADSGLCFSLAGVLNGVLLVMDGQSTPSHLAARAKHRLHHANAALLGVILNNHACDLPNWLDARI
jgi:Mrp family chromosome partitioning ATPase